MARPNPIFTPVAGELQAPLHTGARTPRVDFLGIGAQKAGTTWLHRMLGAHPEIFMARADDKDLRFFSAYYDCGHVWYEQHFATGDGAKRRGEFSTSYFYSAEAPQRVRRYNPEMRLVLSLRDPVARLISQHRHEIRIGHLTDMSLERAIANNPSYVEQSMYATQLARWLEHFSLSSFHVVIFEELFRDPARALRELYEFVGVSPTFMPDNLHEKINEGRVPRSRLLDRGVRLSSAALRAVGIGPLVDSLKKRGVARWVERGNSRSDDAVRIDDELIKQLRSLFAPENAQLSRLLSRDLSIWS